jgi:hypothetical protein
MILAVHPDIVGTHGHEKRWRLLLEQVSSAVRPKRLGVGLDYTTDLSFGEKRVERRAASSSRGCSRLHMEWGTHALQGVRSRAKEAGNNVISICGGRRCVQVYGLSLPGQPLPGELLPWHRRPRVPQTERVVRIGP